MPLIIFTMFLSIVVAVFALQNATVVPIKFFFYQQEASLVLVILGGAFLGLLIGASFVMYIKLKGFLQIRKKNDEIEQLKEENLLLSQKISSLEKCLQDTQNNNTNNQEPNIEQDKE